MRNKYIAPKISEDIVLELENEILQASAVIDDDTEVVSCGQEVVEIDLNSFTSTGE